MKVLAQGVAALAMLVVSLATTLPAAHSAVWVTHDPAGDAANSSYGDISKVKVRHGRWKVRIRTSFHGANGPGTGEPGEQLEILLNTVPDRNPEFSFSWYDWSADGELHRVGNWDAPVSCRGSRTRVDDGVAVAVIPRRCLKTNGSKPWRVRVNVTSPDRGGIWDHAPGEDQYSPWIRAR